MITSKISFTAGFDNFSLKQQPVSKNTTVATSTIEPTQQNKSNKIKKYTLIGAGILFAGLLIFKGKSILNRFKKKLDTPEIKPHTEEIKPHTEKPQTADTKPKPVEPPAKQAIEAAQQVSKPERYSLIDEYDRLTKARADFRANTQGRALTPEEKAQSEELRLAWSKVYKQLIPQHQSIVKTKMPGDFANEAEKTNYIMNYVLPRMRHSEESALDALDMFEQFGFRADYPNNSINTTITKLAEGIYTLSKECKSDKVLNRFIEVFDKFADNNLTKRPDDEQLVTVLTYFAKEGQDISEDTIVKGINVLKRIISQKWCHENLAENLIAYESKFKDSQPVIKALDELKIAAKDCIYGLEAGDR